MPNLTSAIVAFTPRDPQRVVVDHPFRQEFLLMPLPEAAARTYLCGTVAAPPSGAEYYAVVFSSGGPGGQRWACCGRGKRDSGSSSPISRSCPRRLERSQSLRMSRVFETVQDVYARAERGQSNTAPARRSWMLVGGGEASLGSAPAV